MNTSHILANSYRLWSKNNLLKEEEDI